MSINIYLTDISIQKLINNKKIDEYVVDQVIAL